jgi:hypothetical protein
MAVEAAATLAAMEAGDIITSTTVVLAS